MAKDVTKSVLELLQTYPKLESFLYFNANDFGLCKVSLHASTGVSYEKKYIRGGAIKSTVFDVIIVKPYDVGTSDVNYNEYHSVVEFMQWIESINNKETLNKFNKHILSIENEQSEPRILSVATDGTKAKYSFTIKVIYEQI